MSNEQPENIAPRMVHVNAGSNKGNSRLNLTRAMKGIGEEFGPYEISHIMTSEAWGYQSKRSFLNIGIQFESAEPAEVILEKLLRIQNSISTAPHRTPDGDYADREIDLDLVALGDEVHELPDLTVPHRHLGSSRFFLEPLAELAPDWRHPLTGKDAATMLAELDQQ